MRQGHKERERDRETERETHTDSYAEKVEREVSCCYPARPDSAAIECVCMSASRSMLLYIHRDHKDC